MTKAFAAADDDEQKAGAAYIRYRVQALEDEYLQDQDALERATAVLRERSSSSPAATPPVYHQYDAERAWFDEEERFNMRR